MVAGEPMEESVNAIEGVGGDGIVVELQDINKEEDRVERFL